ncbi:hypothetical protein YZOS03_00580 [Vibrio alginolyticus]|nr:hypothetical protein YZOS03_00580 [Vibrio alginolyticus]BCG19234.1 hypothetical protein HLBS07_30860 [Vibrio alginolyticus]
MTSKNNDQKNNDKNLSEETSSAPLVEKTTSQQDADLKKEQPQAAEPPKNSRANQSRV